MSPSAPNPSLSRRGFLGAAGATATVAALPAATGAAAPVRRRTGVFAHAVASGDPLPDGVILWTRVTPTRDATPGSGRGAASEVRWEVATDPEFRSIAAAGATSTDAARDHTVKVDARGLAPRTTAFLDDAFGATFDPKLVPRTTGLLTAPNYYGLVVYHNVLRSVCLNEDRTGPNSADKLHRPRRQGIVRW
ncbi:phospholipase D [Gordonia araii NBRC 100433]|uniref:Phospholipase D n=1 Tax=Gordonia araii NBRC 100433 TaxID=1073574 RepID=G7H0Y0_9ACTN|nr:phospholipase D [Gordonia araii NBRC 100433]